MDKATGQIYMDYNATTPVRMEVLEAMLPFFSEKFGNPSSVHWGGRQVKGAIEEAREHVARLVNCDPSEVIFTAGGSEADNMAVKGVAAGLLPKGNHILTTQVEHPAVINTCRYLERTGYEVTWLHVDDRGLPDLEEVERSITDRTILISAMYANNETGVLLPVEKIGELAARRGVYFHCDAVQAAGRIPVDCRAMNIQLLSLSGHKLYAPKGVGALIVRKGVKAFPLIHGGSQERSRRAGTENVPGIVAFGKACELAADGMACEADRLENLRDRLEQKIAQRVKGIKINGHSGPRLPNTSNISFSGVAADSLLLSLDLEGVAVSSGAACGSGTLKVSHVLAAMGLPSELAKGSIRFSLGRGNSEADVDRVLDILPGIVDRLRVVT